MQTIYQITGEAIIAYKNGKQIGRISKNDDIANYYLALEKIKGDNPSEAEKLFKSTQPKTTTKLPKGFRVSRAKQKLYYNNREWVGMYDVLLNFSIAESQNWKKNFLQLLVKLVDVPKAQRELLAKFLHAHKDGVLIDKSGNLLLWKRVRDNLDSYHVNDDGTPFKHTIGKRASIPESKVEKDTSILCASGLHVCTYQYLSSFYQNDGVILLCKVNPKDIISIPAEEGLAKLRVMGYTPILKLDQNHSDNAVNYEVRIHTPEIPATAQVIDMLLKKRKIKISVLKDELGFSEAIIKSVIKRLQKISGISISLSTKSMDTSYTKGYITLKA